MPGPPWRGHPARRHSSAGELNLRSEAAILRSYIEFCGGIGIPRISRAEPERSEDSQPEAARRASEARQSPTYQMSDRSPNVLYCGLSALGIPWVRGNPGLWPRLLYGRAFGPEELAETLMPMTLTRMLSWVIRIHVMVPRHAPASD